MLSFLRIASMVIFNRKHQLYEDMYRCQYNLSGIYQRIGNLGLAIRFVDMAIKCASVNMRDKLAEKEALMLKAKVVSQVLIRIVTCRKTFFIHPTLWLLLFVY